MERFSPQETELFDEILYIKFFIIRTLDVTIDDFILLCILHVKNFFPYTLPGIILFRTFEQNHSRQVVCSADILR